MQKVGDYLIPCTEVELSNKFANEKSEWNFGIDEDWSLYIYFNLTYF